jgi:Spy/CpxP family protein refolding chaperone
MDKMWQLRTKHRDEARQIGYELFQKRLEARNLFTDPKADDGSIIAKQKEINALQQRMQEKMVQLKLEERKILTPEQLQKLKEMPQGYGPRGKRALAG